MERKTKQKETGKKEKNNEKRERKERIEEFAKKAGIYRRRDI